MASQPKILFVHQGYELYGSDRSFMQSIVAMRQLQPDAELTAIIPQEGPLAAALRPLVDRLIFEALFVPRKNQLIKLFTVDLLRFPFRVLAAWRRMRSANLTYINTLTILDYNIAARFCRTPSIIHVREIVDGKAGRLFAAILRFSRATILFNSQATADSFPLIPGQPRRMIYNGVPANENPTFPAASETLKLLVIGRFNSWKGQDILVDAIARLSPTDQERVSVRLVGGVFENQRHFVDTIRAQIDRLQLADRVTIHDFTSEPEAHYRWADVVVVPSKKPEPFGRVAIEAMAEGRPVLAADHGGLSEIVKHGDGGWLFAPGDAEDCARQLRAIISELPVISDHGTRAYARFRDHFSEQQYQQSMADCYAEALAG